MIEEKNKIKLHPSLIDIEKYIERQTKILNACKKWLVDNGYANPNGKVSLKQILMLAPFFGMHKWMGSPFRKPPYHILGKDKSPLFTEKSPLE